MAEELQKPAERHAYATPSSASGNSQLSFQGGSSTRSGCSAGNRVFGCGLRKPESIRPLPIVAYGQFLLMPLRRAERERRRHI
jgi:hypothetical protein